jgi:hypothetical protein
LQKRWHSGRIADSNLICLKGGILRNWIGRVRK